MSPDWAAWTAFALYALIVLRWMWGHVEITAAKRALLLRPAKDTTPETSAARVTVIVAAHDEAATIGRCLEHLLAQTYPDLQIIVANDRSRDDTGQIVRDIARTHTNVRCIDIPDLPDGWLGKTHALSVAAEHAGGDYLLFVDSDVSLHPATLATVMALVQRRALDFVSLWPKVIAVGFWERTLLPACGNVLSLWFHSSRPASDDAVPVFANGQFLMIRRDAYEKIGGHAAVRDEMAEDVSLAKLASAAGLRRFLGLGRELLETRMYENLNQIVHGWTRIFIGALGARWKYIASAAALVLGSLSPFIVLIALAAHVAGGGSVGTMVWAWLAAAIAHLVAMFTVNHRQTSLSFEGGAQPWVYPLAIVGTIVLLLYCIAVSSGWGTIRWGNMRYRVAGSRAVHGRPVEP